MLVISCCSMMSANTLSVYPWCQCHGSRPRLALSSPQLAIVRLPAILVRTIAKLVSAAHSPVTRHVAMLSATSEIAHERNGQARRQQSSHCSKNRRPPKARPPPPTKYSDKSSCCQPSNTHEHVANVPPRGAERRSSEQAPKGESSSQYASKGITGTIHGPGGATMTNDVMAKLKCLKLEQSSCATTRMNLWKMVSGIFLEGILEQHIK